MAWPTDQLWSRQFLLLAPAFIDSKIQRMGIRFLLQGSPASFQKHSSGYPPSPILMRGRSRCAVLPVSYRRAVFMSPGKWRSYLLQGWVCTDDYVKPRGQATSAKTTSYMAQPSTPPLPSSSLLDLVLRSTNETRLQELYELYHRRKLIGPGPGEHNVRHILSTPSCV